MTDTDNTLWHDIREGSEHLDPGALLVTPVSERPFRVAATFGDRVVVRFEDSGKERQLWREQFEVLVDRLDDGPIAVADLPPGVEPYASVLSLSAEYVADGETIHHAPDETASGESPYLVPPEEARKPPERVHDDALLLADLLDHLDATDPESLDTDALTDLYVLLSDVQSGTDRLRRSAREPLLDRLGPDQELSGQFGTVRRTTRQRRRPKDDEAVLDALDEYGIPHEWVLGVDPDKLDVVLAVTDLSENEVYDVEEQVYVQKTGVDESEKFSRLQGLADRIEEVDGVEGERLREELASLEARLDEALPAG
jgi:hypothetical protein